MTIYPLRRAARWEAKALGLLGDHEAMRHVRAHWSVDLQIKAVRLQAASRVREAERACAAEVARWEEVRDNLMARVRLSDAAEVRRALREAGVGLPPPVPRRNAEDIRLADWIRQHNPDPVLRPPIRLRMRRERPSKLARRALDDPLEPPHSSLIQGNALTMSGTLWSHR